MLLKDEECACFPEKKLKFIFGFFLLISINISAQVILNNFGRLESIKTYSGYKKIVLLDFNNDGYQDIFLCGNNRKNFVLHKNLSDSTYSEPIRKFFLFPIDDIKWLTKTKTGIDYYLFISRNKRLVGLASFTKQNTLQLLNTIEFNSYPSAIKIVDLNNDGENEALIYGNNFDGLSVVKNIKYKLSANKLINQMVVKDLEMIDFNQDGFKDIVLIDMLNNSLKFYENYASGKINFNRELEFTESLSGIKKSNYNSDDFDDLVLTREHSLEILIGDSVYSFNDHKVFNYEFTPDNVLFTDVTSDSLNEKVFLDKTNNRTVIEFSDSLENNYENKYLFDELSDVVIKTDSSKKSLLLLSSLGKINILSNSNNSNNSKKNFNFSIGGKPSIIRLKNNKKDKTTAIVTYETVNNDIRIFAMDSLSNVNKLKKFHLFNKISDFVLYKKSQIIGYQKNSRLLEVLKIGEIAKANNHIFIYSAKPIQKIKFKNNLSFTVLESENKILFKQKFNFKKNKYVPGKLEQIDTSVISSAFGNFDEIFYWKQTEGKISLYKYFNNSSHPLLSFKVSDTLNVKAKFIKNSNNRLTHTIIQYDGKTFLYSLTKKKIEQNEINTEEILANMEREKIQYFYYAKTNSKNLLYFNRKKNKLVILTLNGKKNKFEKVKEIFVKNVNDFYVDIIFNKLYFVYSNSKNYCISFKEIE